MAPTSFDLQSIFLETIPLTLLTGVRGAGKTSFCFGVAKIAQVAGYRIGGLISPARFERNYKVGIDVLDVGSGQRRLLARRREKSKTDKIETKHWQFNSNALTWGTKILQQATPCDLLIIDELGPLEFEDGGGWSIAPDIIVQRNYRHALVVIRPELLTIAQNRWADIPLQIIEI